MKYYNVNKLIGDCFKIASLKIIIIGDKALDPTYGIGKIVLTVHDDKIANDFTVRAMLNEKIYKKLHEDKINKDIVIFYLGNANIVIPISEAALITSIIKELVARC